MYKNCDINQDRLAERQRVSPAGPSDSGKEARVKRLLAISLAGGAALLSGCVFIPSSTLSDRPPASNATTVRVVEEGELGVLHLSSPKDLTTKADADLLAQCPSGRLVNVRTQLSDRDWIWIVQDYKLRAEADCLPVPPAPAPVKAPAPKKPLLEAKKTERGLVFTLGNLLFDTNKTSLRPGAEHRLDKLAAYLKNEPARRIMIEGYTDSTGRAAYNRMLSEKRAHAVEAALRKIGVGATQIARVKGYGALYPVASNKTVRGRQENRRVEIVISDATGAFKKNR